MKHIILIFVAVCLLTACGAHNTPQVVADVVIELAVEPSPPTVGAATLLITVSAADGTPINDATVNVHGNMDHVGILGVKDVRIGKRIEIALEAADEAAAKALVDQACQKFLANLIMETYSFEVKPA